jgi:outer membrane protein assembly factor BamE (lipoprotein component of BamABCDE complex)
MNTFTLSILFTSLTAMAYYPSYAQTEPTTAESVVFPRAQNSYLKTVPRYPASTLALLDVGLSKDQVRGLLGNPHFKEGIWRNRQWNYVLDLRGADQSVEQRCQLRIDFDRQQQIQHWYWKEQSCAALVVTDPAAPQTTPVAAL